jgi:uncharacterized membrane protein
MKNFEDVAGLLGIVFGMIGAMIKGIKQKYPAMTTFLGMVIAGILTYATTGLIEIFYADMPTKVVILISFIVGWVANEITAYLDRFVGDVYAIFMDYLRSKIKKK